MNPYAAEQYARAAAATGKSVDELLAMAKTVFASMLKHAMDEPGSAIWSVISIEEGQQLYVEVNIPARNRQILATLEMGRKK
jgi:hypothetical protein